MNDWFATEGSPSPLGVTWVPAEEAFNFALYSEHATAVLRKKPRRMPWTGFMRRIPVGTRDAARPTPASRQLESRPAGDDRVPARGFLALRIRDAGSQARMRASVVVVRHPFRQDGPQMPFIQQDQPIQTLATHAADQPLAKCVRLRGPHGCLESRQTHGRQCGIDALGIDAVAVVNDPSIGLLA